jgi:hypothetical protein
LHHSNGKRNDCLLASTFNSIIELAIKSHNINWAKTELIEKYEHRIVASTLQERKKIYALNLGRICLGEILEIPNSDFEAKKAKTQEAIEILQRNFRTRTDNTPMAILNFNFESLDFNLVLRCLDIELIFEANALNVFDSIDNPLEERLASFNHFLSTTTKELSAKRKKRFKNFINFVKKLYNMPNYGILNQKNILKNKINEEVNIVEKEWLLQKCQ